MEGNQENAHRLMPVRVFCICLAAGHGDLQAGFRDVVVGGAGGEFHVADVKRLFGQGKFVHDLLRGQPRDVVGGAGQRDTARRSI